MPVCQQHLQHHKGGQGPLAGAKDREEEEERREGEDLKASSTH